VGLSLSSRLCPYRPYRPDPLGGFFCVLGLLSVGPSLFSFVTCLFFVAVTLVCCWSCIFLVVSVRAVSILCACHV